MWTRLTWMVPGVVCLGAELVVAQAIGFQGGATINPEQVYVGTHLELPIGSDDFLIRPGIDGGFGEDLMLATMAVEFLYRFDLGGTNWAIYQGTGPAVAIVRVDDKNDVTGGLSYVFGFAHENGFFTEFKGGGSGLADVKFGVGFTFR